MVFGIDILRLLLRLLMGVEILGMGLIVFFVSEGIVIGEHSGAVVLDLAVEHRSTDKTRQVFFGSG